MTKPDNQYINIYISIKGKDICISYNQDGMLEFVTDVTEDKKMMVEIMVKGVGYEIKFNQGMLIDGNVCDARYMELDYFVPKYLFIKNE